VIGNQILSTWFADHYYTKALLARKKLQTHFSENFREVDFIISPVTPNKVPSLGEQCDDQVAMYMSDLYTVWFSLWGLPTLSVPLASPAGIQITGAYDNDANVLRLGHMLEQKFPTIGRQ
jgi:aspartyl-tRNA(Asn)/glutamyl-tRNA(Gln) amidotransferase subunit A